MKVLLANDDGVNAPGIRTLYKQLNGKFKTTVVAPLEERSTTGHSLSLDKPLRLEKLEDNIYGCSGFPADCALMGLGHVMKNDRPDVLVSGINRGANLGQDLYYSGTIGAAREATFHGVQGIAVSLVLENLQTTHHYESASQVIEWLLEYGAHKALPPLTVLNINVPNLPLNEIRGAAFGNVGFRHYSEEIHERKDSRDRSYYWIAGIYKGHQGHSSPTDSEIIAEKKVAITAQPLIDGVSREYNSLNEIISKINQRLVG